MALVRSQYNACFDWLISGHYSSIMPMGRLRGCKNKIKTKLKQNVIINYCFFLKIVAALNDTKRGIV